MFDQTIRSVLTTNCTFMHFMLKVGAFTTRRPHRWKATTRIIGFDKVAADAFETLISAYYYEKGFHAVCTWVSEALGPMIMAAWDAYGEL